MRSGTNCTITSGEVYSWSQECLLQAKLVKDHGWLCTATVVLGIVLRAAARSISVSAACRDLAKGPSDQAVMTALEDGLPKTLPVLERRLERGPGRLPAASHAAPGLAGGDRLALATRTTGSRTRAATKSTTASRSRARASFTPMPRPASCNTGGVTRWP